MLENASSSTNNERVLIFTFQDLTYSGDGHNWKSIIFSLLVIGLIIAGIVTAIYLLG